MMMTVFRSNMTVEYIAHIWRFTPTVVTHFIHVHYTPCPEKGATNFCAVIFYKYWRIFIIFCAKLHKRMPKSLVKNSLPHVRYVATIPCESLRHKSNTFHTNILHMFISITFTETSIDETNKTQQKVRSSKFMFKMSTIHANTCIQTTTPLHNRWWFRWQCPVLMLCRCTSWNQGLRSTVTITGIQFC